MSEKPTVREAVATDAPAVRRVARAAWHAAYDDLLGHETVEETVDAWYDPEALEADVDREDRPFYVAERNEEFRGFTVATPHDATGTYSVYRLYVDPEHWGRGVGTRLLNRLEGVLRERGIERLRLRTYAANDVAVSFYESRGFERVALAYDEDFSARRYVYAKELPPTDRS